jgi:UDP-N-acetyl-D-mannosaminuronic acid dehydrogenase
MVLGAAVKSGKLRAITKPEAADAFVIAVPTPITHDHKADISAVEAALKSIAAVLKRGDLIIIESTSPVGTTEHAATLLRKLRPELSFPDTNPEQSDILLAYCPERILPGRTLRELTENARVLGGLDRLSAVRAKELYASFAMGPMRLTTARVAELSKLVENAFRDVNVAFANELSLVCDSLGIDVWSVIQTANLHPRVNILSARPRRRRALHSDRPVVHPSGRTRADAADQGGPRSQRWQAAFRRRPHRQACQALSPAGHRTSRPVL